MIPLDFLTEWRARAPWASQAQVEQDLVICRALVELYRDREVADCLAFRGGTALFKLHLAPAARYSEDIDLVQVAAGPIGPILDRIRAALDPWLGEPRRLLKEGRVNLSYRFASNDTPSKTLRLKIEINSREHFCELGHVRFPFEVGSRWFDGAAEITTFELDELLATKLRALYQRRKGRDLFDLWYALENASVSPERVVRCFQRYLSESGRGIPRQQFAENLAAKLENPLFRADISPLLELGADWDMDAAARVVTERFIALLPDR